jgi:hypothetical protein
MFGWRPTRYRADTAIPRLSRTRVHARTNNYLPFHFFFFFYISLFHLLFLLLCSFIHIRFNTRPTTTVRQTRWKTFTVKYNVITNTRTRGVKSRYRCVRTHGHNDKAVRVFIIKLILEPPPCANEYAVIMYVNRSQTIARGRRRTPSCARRMFIARCTCKYMYAVRTNMTFT